MTPAALALCRDFPASPVRWPTTAKLLHTDRGAASIAWLDATTLKTKSVLKTGARPNGAAIVKRLDLGIAACIGDDSEAPSLHVFRLNDRTA